MCLDFVNTIDWRGRAEPREFLNSYQDLISWARHVGILSKQNAELMTRKAEKRSSDAIAAVEKAKGIREALYRIFIAKTKGVSAKKADLVLFNKVLSRTMAQSRIVEAGDVYVWSTGGREDALDGIINPIVRSAADLLLSSDLKRVKSCADAECGWLFFDSSRNRSRRWCDMSDCGNRAKASRFYLRKKKDARA